MKRLSSEGDEVRALDIRSPGEGEGVEGVEYVVGDLRDADSVAAAVEGVEMVYHTASLTETNGPARLFQEINVDGTTNVLVAAANSGSVKGVVYTSSASVVFSGSDIEGGNEDLAIPENHLDAYSASKAAAEANVLAADGVGGVRTVAIRPHTIFGEGDVHVFPRIFANAAAGKMKYVLGSGTVLHDYTYVQNCVDGHVLAARAILSDPDVVGGQAYFITNEEPRNFWDTTYDLVNRMGYDAAPKFRIPFFAARAIAFMFWLIATVISPIASFKPLLTPYVVANVCTSHYFSCQKARDHFGYSPRVPLDRAFTTTLAWFRQQGYGADPSQ